MAEIQIVNIDCQEDEFCGRDFYWIDGGRVLGACRLSDLMEPVALLSALFVDEAHRRRGIAKALITRCVEWSMAAGKISLSLNVKRKNLAAIMLYEKMGFSKCWTGPDSFFMCKLLPRPGEVSGDAKH